MPTCYSPVRQSPAGEASFSPAALRLACVKPAASVHPEPGSNSPLLYLVSFFLHKIFSATLLKERAYVLFVLTRTSLYSWLRNRTETYVSLVSISQHSSRMSLLVLVALCHCSCRSREFLCFTTLVFSFAVAKL